MSCFPTLARRWQRSSGVSGLLLESAQAHPGLPFLEDRFGHAMTDAETAGQVRAFAGFLRRSGLKRGDRFAILASNRAEVAVAVFATALAGGIFTILNPKLRPKGLAAILGQAEPFLIVVDPTTAATLEEVGGGGSEPTRDRRSGLVRGALGRRLREGLEWMRSRSGLSRLHVRQHR